MLLDHELLAIIRRWPRVFFVGMLPDVKVECEGQMYILAVQTSIDAYMPHGLCQVLESETKNRGIVEMSGEFLRLLFLQAHRETTAHFTAIGMPAQQHCEAYEKTKAHTASDLETVWVH